MKSDVEILSVKRNNIIFKTKTKNMRIYISMCLTIVVGFLTFFSIGGISIKQIGKSMYYIYNPVNSLYSDNSNIVFTSVYSAKKDSLNFVIPIVGAKILLEDNGDIEMTVGDSIMVKSIESGVVEEVGTTLDGVKFIKILHCLDVYSVIENLDIIGIREGDVVKKGQDIATALEGSRVVLKLYDAEMQISNLKINQSKILWLN